MNCSYDLCICIFKGRSNKKDIKCAILCFAKITIRFVLLFAGNKNNDKNDNNLPFLRVNIKNGN